VSLDLHVHLSDFEKEGAHVKPFLAELEAVVRNGISKVCIECAPEPRSN
jgi:hypothetical protein